MRKFLLLPLCFVLSITVGFSQTQNIWSLHKDNSGKITTDKAVARQSFPTDFKLFDLNIIPLKQELFSVVEKQSGKSSTLISLPNAAGNIEQFEVNEASNFEPKLQAQFPQIRAFSGKGITDKFATLKLSISPQGIQAMIFRTDSENEFIEAYSKDHSVYAAFKSSRAKGQLGWTCSTDDKNMLADLNQKIIGSNKITSTASSAGELKTMRLAQSCNGEYANYFGATSAAQVGLVMAAYNATLTRANGVYEKDLALHLDLIASTTTVIYYNPATDPYTTLSAWNLQLQQALTANIGEANYDIGHMFGASGGGGNAGCIGCVCVSPPVNGMGVPTGNGKGSGITSPADGIPQGDNFDIDYVVHEVGHQLGANHTFSMSLEGSGVNKEVGSGITIMGYAGITAQDVAPHSIDIFHQASIQQIQNNLATKTCPVTTAISATNATPVVAPFGNFTIPISTPFALTGSATDANPGDALTYCWEQNDNSTVSGVNSVASPTKAGGPNWLSFNPTSNPTRTFPILATILAGNYVTGPLPGGDAGANIEALSSVGRNLNFRLTVRDNSPYSSTAPLKIGQTAFTDMVVTVDATSGPFQVTVPNTGVSYPGGSSQTITWDVNNTTAAPVNCANVKISYSTDGGLSFPNVLLASTPNDGSQAVTVPVGTTTTARIKIEAIGNIFFDISNTNFTVTTPLSEFNFTPSTPTTLGCGATSASVSIATTTTGGFTTPIALTSLGVPAGTTVTFVPNPLTPGNTTVATLSGTGSLAPGTYTISVTGTAGAVVKNTTITFIVPVLAAIINTQPLSTTVCAPSNATFSVTASGLNPTYQWQVSSNGGTTFTDITGATSPTYIFATSPTQNNNRYRVNVFSTCSPTIPTTSNAATLTVNSPATITGQPLAQSGCALANFSFSVVAVSGTNSPTYQWQVSMDGGITFSNIPGETGAMLSINNAALSLNGNIYRVIVSSTGCNSVNSNGAMLRLSAKPAVVITAPVTSNLNPAINSMIYATVSPANLNILYSWKRNGIIIQSAIASSSIILNVDDQATYELTVTDVTTGCQSTSNTINTLASKSDNLIANRVFVYPNPVLTTMQVRFNNSSSANRGTMLNIYDEKGVKVFSKSYTIAGTQGRMEVDMSGMQNGTYMVYIMDNSGNKLGSSKVVKIK